MAYDSIIFDLDGTLWDACEGVARGWNLALEKLKLPHRVTRQQIASVCGLPQEDCARTLLPELVGPKFSEIFSLLNVEEQKSVASLGGQLYPYVLEGLGRLKTEYRLFIVSNCQDWYLECFLNRDNFRNVFRESRCHGGTGKPKGENIKDLVREHGLINPVYVGDTVGDLRGAQEASIDFIHVTYGFGKVENEKNFGEFSELVNFFI